jgi:hypothetical protein
MRNFCACGDGQVHGVDALPGIKQPPVRTVVTPAFATDLGERTLAGPYQQGTNTSATIGMALIAPGTIGA